MKSVVSVRIKIQDKLGKTLFSSFTQYPHVCNRSQIMKLDLINLQDKLIINLSINCFIFILTMLHGVVC